MSGASWEAVVALAYRWLHYTLPLFLELPSFHYRSREDRNLSSKGVCLRNGCSKGQEGLGLSEKIFSLSIKASVWCQLYQLNLQLGLAL